MSELYYQIYYPVCPICKKAFAVRYRDLWVYKRRDPKYRMKYCCSWTCYRAYEEIMDERQARIKEQRRERMRQIKLNYYAEKAREGEADGRERT